MNGDDDEDDDKDDDENDDENVDEDDEVEDEYEHVKPGRWLRVLCRRLRRAWQGDCRLVPGIPTCIRMQQDDDGYEFSSS